MYIELLRHGHDERDDDKDGREDVHHAPDQQQEDVEPQQKNQAGADIRLCPFHEQERYFRVDQIRGEPDRHTQDDQDPADQHDTLGEGFPQSRTEREVTMDDTLDERGIEGGKRGGLNQGGEPTEHDAEHHEWDADFPLGVPQRRPELRPAEAMSAGTGDEALAHTPYGGQTNQEHAWHDPGNEQVRGRDLGDDRIQDQRHRRGKQQPERPGRRQQSE